MTNRDDPSLAEGQWLWRRLYAFVFSAALWGLLWRAIDLTPPEMMLGMARGLMGLMALILMLYLVAPTAQQLANTLGSARLGAGARP